MAIALSPRDVERLLAEPSSDLRAELAGKVADGLTGPGLSSGEIALAQDVLRILARDVEAKVRASISTGLRNSLHLPRDVAQRLCDDIDTVALPLLRYSEVLTDEDLINIVRGGTARKHEAIAGRSNLTESISDALITHAEEPAIALLMGNLTARINENSLNRAVTRFAGSARVKEAMVLRHSLPLTVSERLVTLVSGELQRHLLNMHTLSPTVAADIVLRSREQAIIHLSTGSSEADLAVMVNQMQRNGRLSPTLIVRALCTGDIAFFEAAIAARGDVPIANAQILIHESSRRGLAALYRKAKMPDSLFDTVCAAIEAVNETGFDGDARDLERFRGRVISRVLTNTGSIDFADADYLVDKLTDVL
jgi:uncharacterized protein (DUF2336 family)